MQDILSDINAYCEEHSTVFDPVLSEIERATFLRTLAPRMLSGQLQGSLLTMISKIKQPANILEVGTFTGYSAICLAKGLAPSGKLITIEYDPENAFIVAEFIKMSGLGDSIQLMIGDAKNIIPELDQVFDLVFIDADKEAYSLYFDLIIDKCSPGALILADNVLWSGKILNEKKDKKTKLIDDFNKKVLEDQRVENVILPIRDGINLIRKI
jgi:predicted O-methyltransferase YrrM